MRMKTKRWVGFFTCLAAFLAGWTPEVTAGEASAAPIEIGRVSWVRDLDEGLSRAKVLGKPVFLLFQEVPGCSGCQNFGREVLSDPRMVTAIETHFVPVFIPDNQPGKAAEVLKRFGEPAWNFQVVRFLAADGKDLIPREDKVWTVPALAQRMVSSLKKAGLPASEALQLLAGRPAVGGSPRQKIAFAQACFWIGEMQLGQIDGVERTEAGFFEGREVTLVEFDPQRVTLPDLVKAALARHCADRIYAATPMDKSAAEAVAPGRQVKILNASYRAAPASDQKKQLQGTAAQGRSLTPEQATKVNAFIRTDPARAARYLAESQGDLDGVSH